MDIEHLTEEELLIEIEIRHPSGKPLKKLTESAKFMLIEKLAEEQKEPKKVPQTLHEAARKNPRRELGKLAEKLEEIKQQLLSQGPQKIVADGTWKFINSKLQHIHGRLERVSANSAAIKADAPKVFKAYYGLTALLQCIVAETPELDQAIDEAAGIEIPIISLLEEYEEGPVGESDAPGTSYGNGERPATSNMGVSTNYVDIRDDDSDEQGSLNNGRRSLKIDLNEKLQKLEGEANGHRRGVAQLNRARHCSEVSEDSLEINELGATELPLDSKVCKDPSTWNVKFEGARSTTHVERFFYRAERMAVQSKIPLNSLVDYMSLLLTGEALEWYWTYLERHQRVSWETLKREMIQRFQSSRSDDDVRRLLSQRKQLYPRETFLEFHDAILKLALQAKRPIRDQEIYNILRRNMRPGLQLELFETKNYPSVSHFVRKCVALEDLWKRFGVNPESRLSIPQHSHGQHQNNYNNNNYNNRFQNRVHETVQEIENPVYLEGEPEYSDDDIDEYNNQLCSINPHNQIKSNNGNTQVQQGNTQQHREFRPPHQQGYNRSPPTSLNRDKPQITIMRRPEVNKNFESDRSKPHCWNCGDERHTFFDCRKPIRQVFCFGCGTRGVYKPDCGKCNKRPENWRTEMRNRESHFGNTSRTQNQTSQNMNTEEAASNTDPELHQRR